MVIKRNLFAAGTLSVLALPATAMESAEGEMAEVIVTAQGREQRLQDVPVAVSVVSGADLERVNIKTLQDVTSRLANVKITTGTLTNPINVRGIGSGNNSGFEQSVATFSDGVYRPRSRSTNAALLDLERVEVLKGPQTTFFGANAIAGALNITTRKPGSEFSSNASALYAFDDGEYNIEGGVTLPASDTLSFRLAARVSGMDGYMRLRDGSDKGPHDKSLQGRASMRWTPSDSFRSDLRFDAGKSETDDAVPLEIVGCPPGAGYPAPAPPPPGRAPTNCFLALNAGVASFEDDLDYHSNAPETWYDYDFYEGAWTNAFQTGVGTLTSITSYFHQEANNRTQLVPLDISPFTARNYDALPSEVREQYHQAAQELRFESKAGERVDYMVGAFYRQARWRNTSGTGFFFIPFGAILSGPPFNGPPFNIVTNPTQAYTGVPLIRTSDKTYSAFAAATVKLTDQLSLDLGARYSKIEKTGSRSLTFGTSVNNQFGTFVPFPTAANQIGACVILVCDNYGFSPQDRANRTNTGPYKISDSDFMPSAGLQYKFNDDVMGYAKYTTGFKAGGFSGAATSNVFGPETVDAYEVGLKTSAQGGRLTTNLSLFRMEYKGLQETAYSQTLASLVLNAAESVSQGAELTLDYRVTPQFALRADLALLNSEYKNFTNAPCKSADIVAARCGTVSLGGQDMSGQERPYSPDITGSVGFTWNVPVGSNELRIDPSVYFTSGYFMNAAADPLLRQGGHTKYDLRLGYGPEDTRWEVAFVGKNLTDKETLGIMLEIPGSPGTVSGFPERGRSLALQVTFRN
ncbi:MAG: TonB-dependent receptor [Gammaproteobacteria bacterium]|nr:TonB-dependent receptor [Gammaproteobacteria bacterium]